jgi:hypothetical protein
MDLGNFILSINDDIDECAKDFIEGNKTEKVKESIYSTGIWKMYFDGAFPCEGAGVSVLFVAPGNEFVIPFSYKIQWDIEYKNSICEYKALVLGLEAAKKLNIKNLEVYGDAELIMKQVNR